MHPLVLIALVLVVAVVWVCGILLALVRLANSRVEQRDITGGVSGYHADKKAVDASFGAVESDPRNY